MIDKASYSKGPENDELKKGKENQKSDRAEEAVALPVGEAREKESMNRQTG